MRLKKITALFLTGALILSMAGCAGNGSKDKKEGSAGNEAQEPVKIATKPMTEQFILGEMLKKLIEEKAGYEVELTKGIGGGTSNIQPAMEKGEFDKIKFKRWEKKVYEVYFQKHNRIFYITVDKENIYLLHACRKQKNKTEKTDKKLVRKRASELGKQLGKTFI